MTEVSLRDQLKAAMSGGDAPEPVVTTEPVAPVEAAAPVEKVEKIEVTPGQVEDKADKPTGARERDDNGKFKAAAAPEASPADLKISEPAAAAEANPPPEEPIRVPPSLPAPLKADFKNLAPEWREAFLKRDEEVLAAKAQWDTKAQRLNRLDEIIAPHKDAWAVQGLDDHQALTRLVAAEKVLRETPTQGILYLAQSYGVDLRALVAGGQAEQRPQAAPVDPALQALQAEIQALKDSAAQQSQSASQASHASALAQVAEFAAKPENLYFENVRERVGKLIEIGEATTLADAYEKAIWADPTIRPLLLKEQTAASAKATEAAERAKAAAAKAASGSVTGAPTPGAVPANAGPRGSIREELLAARDAAQL